MGSSFFSNPTDYEVVQEGGEGSSFYDGPAYSEIDPVAVAALATQAAASAAAAAAAAATATTAASASAAAVQAAAGTATPIVDGTAAVGAGVKWAREDHVHPTDTSRADAAATTAALALKAATTYVDTQDATLTTAIALKAPLASPTFTGTPAAPTATVGTNTTQVATTAFVLANAATVPVPSQGRCTLTSGVAVTTSDVAGATSIYFTPANGNQIPLHDGTQLLTTTFTELTLALDANAAHTGYQQSGKNFDLFVTNDAGTVRLGTGPAWSSDTARGTGAGTTELELYNGVWVNKNSMTLRFGSASGDTITVAARRGTCVGSARMTAGGQTEDSKVKRFLFNVYNAAPRPLSRNQTVLSYSYSTASYRQANADTANQIDVLLGLAGVSVDIAVLAICGSSTSTKRTIFTGVGVDSTTVNSGTLASYQQVDNAAIGYSAFAWYKGSPGLGKHSLIWLEKGAGTDTQTWYGNNSSGGDHNPGLSGFVTM